MVSFLPGKLSWPPVVAPLQVPHPPAWPLAPQGLQASYWQLTNWLSLAASSGNRCVFYLALNESTKMLTGFLANWRLTSNKLHVSQYWIRTQDFIVVRPRFIGNDLHPLRAFIDFYEQVQNKRLDTKWESLEICFRDWKKDPLLWNRKSLFIVLH